MLAVVPNVSVGGVHVGDTRAQVVAHFGRPLAENPFGTMSYAPANARRIMDVYRTSGRPGGRVRMILLAGGRVRVQGVGRVFVRGDGNRVLARFGSKLHRFVDETGQPIWTLRARHVATDFFTDRVGRNARVLDVILRRR